MPAALARIGDLALRYQVSGRTLRYYEEIGLLKSVRSESDYRYYDDNAVARLEQILLLRKLDLPIKEICAIFASQDLSVAVAAFTGRLKAIDQELHRLECLRETVTALLALLRAHGYARADGLRLLQEGFQVIQSTPPPTPKEVPPMTIEAIRVRLIELKPMTVAWYRATDSTTPETDAWQVMLPWARSAGLTELPTTRLFGFNNPDPSPDRPTYGYEVWVTLPEGVMPPEPIQVKSFDGGLYAVADTYLHEIGERWQKLAGWLKEPGCAYVMGQHQWLEETITPDKNIIPNEQFQLDLYMPIRHR